jgi:single-strand DNA-binding protein
LSKGFSYAIFEGGLARDPESKSLPSGVKVVNFSLGFERGFGDKVHTCWINCVAFKDQAEFAEKYLKKGKNVRVIGEIDVRSWDDKQTGSKRYATELIVDKIQFVDSPGGKTADAPRQERQAPASRQQAAPPTRTQVSAPNEASFDNSGPFDDEEDIPF